MHDTVKFAVSRDTPVGADIRIVSSQEFARRCAEIGFEHAVTELLHQVDETERPIVVETHPTHDLTSTAALIVRPRGWTYDSAMSWAKSVAPQLAAHFERGSSFRLLPEFRDDGMGLLVRYLLLEADYDD